MASARSKPDIDFRTDADILDYLAHMALSELLSDRKCISSTTKDSLKLVEKFIELVGNGVSEAGGLPPAVRLRLQLLHLICCLSETHWEISFQDLDKLRLDRAERRKRAATFQKYCGLIDDSVSEAFESTRPQFPNPPAITLLDILHFFISCSAQYFHIKKSQGSLIWMELTADLTQLAVIDQFRNHRAIGREVVDVAFAYGYNDEFLEDNGSDYEMAIASAFWDEPTQNESEVWRKCRLCAFEKVTDFLVLLSSGSKFSYDDGEEGTDSMKSRITTIVQHFINNLPPPAFANFHKMS